MRRRMWSVLFVGLALLGAACGDSGDDDGADGGGGSGADVEEAQRIVAEAQKLPEKITVTTPLKARPTRRSIAYLDCGVAECKNVARGVSDAAKAAGWDVKVVPFTPSQTESLLSAFDEAVNAKVDVIAISGFGTDAYPSVLDRLRQAGISLILSVSGPDTIAPPVIAQVGDDSVLNVNGTMVGAFVVADSKGKANILEMRAPEFKNLLGQVQEFDATVTRLCPDCKVQHVDATVAQLQNGELASLVVSRLQRDPDIDYVRFPSGSWAVGIEPALAQAGLTDRVKIVGVTGLEDNFRAVKKGTQSAWTTFPYEYMGWAMVDTALRSEAGEPFQATGVGLPFVLVTEENVEDPPKPIEGPDDFREQFKKLWLVS